jgi:hypothetical protein
MSGVLRSFVSNFHNAAARRAEVASATIAGHPVVRLAA